MVSMGQLLTFGFAAFILIAIPGPSVVFTVGRALAYGRGVALATVVGNSCGLLLVLALVSFGLGALVQESITVFPSSRWPAPRTSSGWACKPSGTGAGST